MKKLSSILAVLFFASLTQASADQNLDSRWLPWVGSWTLVTDSTYSRTDKAGPPTVSILPNEDGQSVRVILQGADGKILDVLAPDGIKKPVSPAGCQGSRWMTWSSDGLRLFSRSELTCDGAQRKMSGVMLLDRRGRWIDIQVVEAGEQPGVWVRKYRPAGPLPPEHLPPPQAESLAVSALSARSKVVRDLLDVDDVLEALEQVGSDAVEAMLVETNARFDLDAKVLKRLAGAKAPDRLIDLMVALSFPDRFVIEKGSVSPYSQRGAAISPPYAGAWDMYSYYYGYPFWYYDPYLRFGRFNAWPIYTGYWNYYPYNGGGGGYDKAGGTSRRGIVVAGSGYTRISERNSDGGAHGRYHSGGYRTSSGGYSSSSWSAGSSGGSSSGGSFGSSGGSVSPGGYSSGGSGGGGTAHPRQ